MIRLTLLLSAALVAAAVPAWAVPVTWSIRSTIVSVNVYGEATPPVAVGETITTTMTFESSTPPASSDDTSARYEGALVSVEAALGSSLLTLVDPGQEWEDVNYVYVYRSWGVFQGIDFELDGYHAILDNYGIGAATVDGDARDAYFELLAEDFTATMLGGSFDLPIEPPWPSYDTTGFQPLLRIAVHTEPTQGYSIDATIEDIQLLPEPETSPSLLAALGLLAARSSRRGPCRARP